MTNAEQREYWNAAAGGDHWVRERDRYDRMLAPFNGYVASVVHARPGERFLDVGCGNGALSLEIGRQVSPGGALLGVDLSASMLGAARERAEREGLSHVSFVQADAQTHTFEEGSFDGVVSRFGVMFFDDPVTAFANLARAVRPSGGRLAFVCWRELLLNDWVMVPAAAALEHVPMPEFGEPGGPGPFSLAEADQVRDMLTSAGWTAIDVQAIEASEWMGTDVGDVVGFMADTEFGRTLFSGVSDDVSSRGWEAVARALEAHTTVDGVHLMGRAWLVTAARA